MEITKLLLYMKRIVLVLLAASWCLFIKPGAVWAGEPIPAKLQATGVLQLRSLDGEQLLCQEFLLVTTDGTAISLAKSNMQSIKYSVNGGNEQLINPGESDSLWLEVNRGAGSYIYSFTDKAGNEYQAALSLNEVDIGNPSQLTSDEANNTYLKLAWDKTDLTAAGQIIHIFPHSSYVSLSSNPESNYLWFKIKDGQDSRWQQQAGQHIFLVCQDEVWYRGVFSWGESVPEVLEQSPGGDNLWFDETGFYPTVIGEISSDRRYFLRVRFRDWDGGLSLTSSGLGAISSSRVYPPEGASIIDSELLSYVQSLDEEARKTFIDKYLLVKDETLHIADLFIPITLPQTATSYTVNLNANIVKSAYGKGNEALAWSFTTMAIPSISGIFPASVPEDYDKGQYILITGQDFYTAGDLKVRFGKTEAYRVQTISDKNGNIALKAYLPRGSKKLATGLYDVTVKNSSTCEETVIGVLSVVQAAELDKRVVDGYRAVKATHYGVVEEAVEYSENRLLLKTRYSDQKRVSLDLHDLMGDSLQKVITVRGKSGDLINELDTRSEWADVIFYEVQLAKSQDDGSITIGRAPLGMESSLRQKLAGKIVRSHLIEVSTENLDIKNIKITFPFQNCDADKLVVMRYDKNYRNWFEVKGRIDEINRKVELNTTQPGYFVAVEIPEDYWYYD